MKKDKKQEELQSRRQFFKKAAKGALPILGAIALSQMPLIGQATQSSSSCSGCNNRCHNSCQGHCDSRCNAYCRDNCRTSCYAGNK